MELPEAMKKAFEYLEANYQVIWRTGKGSRENLLDAFSQNEFPKAEYLGYLGSDGIRHAFHRAIANCDKPKNMLWENWLLINIGYFQCSVCKKILPLENKRTSNDYKCKECDRISGNTVRESNQQFIAEYLLNSNGCTDCGEKDIRCLEFDHINPEEKAFNIGEGYRKPRSILSQEINKCQIVCANCHRKRTASTYGYYRHKNYEQQR